MSKTKKEKEVVDPTPKKRSRFFTRKSDMRRETTKLIKFSKFYQDTKLWQKILISIAIGLVMSIVSVLFTESTGLYVGGLSSFFQGTARFVRSALVVANNKNHFMNESMITLVYQLMFWGQYLIVNVGLFFLAWKKIGHEFAILSLCYIVTLQAMGFAFDQIPNIDKINIFGDTSTVNGILKMCEVKSIVFNPNNFYILDAGKLVAVAGKVDQQIIVNANITRSMSLMIYAAVYAVLHAICASILLIIGSSTAGSDIISVHVSYKKNKSVGTMMLIINGIGLVLGVIIGSYFSGIVVGAIGGFVDGDGKAIATNAGTFAGVQYLFSANLIGSLVWVVLFTFCVNKFFPWKKFAKVQIISAKSKEINQHLFDIGYQHPATIFDAHGAYSKTNIDVSMFVCQMVEIPKLISHIREVDPNCMITSEIVDDLDGNMTILRHTK